MRAVLNVKSSWHNGSCILHSAYDKNWAILHCMEKFNYLILLMNIYDCTLCQLFLRVTLMVSIIWILVKIALVCSSIEFVMTVFKVVIKFLLKAICLHNGKKTVIFGGYYTNNSRKAQPSPSHISFSCPNCRVLV